MYRKNQRAQQPLLLSDVSELPQRTLKHLKESWAETFRREVFFRIPEDIFQVLYGTGPSRPNVPVNIMVGLEILKEWRGWSDEEMYDHFLFDLQVRYALGCDRFGEGDFDLRTIYYFRRRLSEYALQTGKNLVGEVFKVVTDKQIEKYQIKTHLQRMDSTQILSNIADLSRLELLVEALQRLYRILSPADQHQYQSVFQPYIKETAGQYTYRIHGKEAVWQHIEQVGQVLADLLEKLKAYQEQSIYQTVQRFFDENFHRDATQVKAKRNAEISPGCLQSFDDLEASYRVKCHRAYKGYVGNIAETCDPENPLQLITDVQVEPNRTSDIALLRKALVGLEERTELKTLITDGGYVSPVVDIQLMKSGIEQITTGLTGTLPDHQDGKLALSDFEMELDPEANVVQATCPMGQPAVVHRSGSQKSFTLEFDPKVCLVCPLHPGGQCPVQTHKKKTRCFLTVPKERAISSQRRRRFERCKEEARALRPAVEATIYQVKHALKHSKVRVRGLFRTSCVVLCSVLAVNMRRINRYESG